MANRAAHKWGMTFLVVVGVLSCAATATHGVRIDISQAAGSPGGDVVIETVLDDEGQSVAAIQNDIEFDGLAVTVPEKMVAIRLNGDIGPADTEIPLGFAAELEAVGTIVIEGEEIDYSGIDGNTLTGALRGRRGTIAAAHAAGVQVGIPTGKPDCRIGSEIRGAAFFAYTEQGIRAVVLSYGPDGPESMPDGSVLYTCTFRVSEEHYPELIPLTCRAPQASDGMRPAMSLPAACGDGSIDIPCDCLGDIIDPSCSITAAELASALNAFGRRNPELNPSADRDGDGVEASELATVIINFGRRACLP